MAERPVHEIRLGRIKAAIWRNHLEEGGVRHNVTIVRIYKADGAWEQTTSFGRDDLPLVVKVADLAHLWIYEQGNGAEAPAEQETSPEPQPTTKSPKRGPARR
jgi:hypothetical protein